MADDNIDETMVTSEVEDVDEKDETFAMNDSDAAGSDDDSEDGSEDDYIEGKQTTKKQPKKAAEKKKTTTVRRPRKIAQRESTQETIDTYSAISSDDIKSSTEGLSGIKIPVRISFSTSSKAK